MKTLVKQVKQRFSIRVGKWELILWEILKESPQEIEPAQELQPKDK